MNCLLQFFFFFSKQTSCFCLMMNALFPHQFHKWEDQSAIGTRVGLAVAHYLLWWWTMIVSGLDSYRKVRRLNSIPLPHHQFHQQWLRHNEVAARHHLSQSCLLFQNYRFTTYSACPSTFQSKRSQWMGLNRSITTTQALLSDSYESNG